MPVFFWGQNFRVTLLENATSRSWFTVTSPNGHIKSGAAVLNKSQIMLSAVADDLGWLHLSKRSYVSVNPLEEKLASGQLHYELNASPEEHSFRVTRFSEAKVIQPRKPREIQAGDVLVIADPQTKTVACCCSATLAHIVFKPAPEGMPLNSACFFVAQKETDYAGGSLACQVPKCCFSSVAFIACCCQYHTPHSSSVPAHVCIRELPS